MDIDSVNNIQIIYDTFNYFQLYSQELYDLIIKHELNINILKIKNMRIQIGKILKYQCKQLWKMSLYYACINELTKLSILLDPNILNNNNLYDELSSEQLMEWSKLIINSITIEQYLKIIIKYILLYYFIIDCLLLDNIWNMKLIFDGNNLIQLLNINKGPQIGELLEKQYLWLLSETQISISSSNFFYNWYHIDSIIDEEEKLKCFEYLKSCI